MDRGTPTCLLRFNLCSPCSKKDILNAMIPFSNSGGRLLINMTSLRSYLVFEFGVDIFDLVLQETHGKTTYSHKPASHVRSTKLRSAFLSGPFMLFQHFTDFTFKWLHLEPYPEILQPVSPPSHHPHQTPSLCPFIADCVPRQIQVRQSRVLLEAFGQGLTGEIGASSPALESIKL